MPADAKPTPTKRSRVASPNRSTRRDSGAAARTGHRGQAEARRGKRAAKQPAERRPVEPADRAGREAGTAPASPQGDSTAPTRCRDADKPARQQAGRQAEGREGRRVMRLVTWNVNSLRVRQERIESWLAEVQPDVVCMQETKLADDGFPALSFSALGYESAHYGQGQWNGVAILSRVGLENVVANFTPGIEPDPDARIITATCGGIRVSSCYVPNGRALDDDHYTYKLSWLDRLLVHLERDTSPGADVVVAGDFNIAPTDVDVYDPQQVRRGDARQRARALATGDSEGLGPHRPVPSAAPRRGVGVLVVGLPRRRLPSGTRAAHRPRARLGIDRRPRRVGDDRPQRSQGRQAERPRAGRRRPQGLTGVGVQGGGDAGEQPARRERADPGERIELVRVGGRVIDDRREHGVGADLLRQDARRSGRRRRARRPAVERVLALGTLADELGSAVAPARNGVLSKPSRSGVSRRW